MSVQPTRTALTRAIRRHVVQVAAEAAAEHHHHRTRTRARGDRSRPFWGDCDRFALALMKAIRIQGEHSLIRFGTGASDWGAARHSAALVAPGDGQRVTYVHRMVGGVFKARPQFHTGTESHDTAARRLTRKHRQLQGLPATWVCMSGTMLGILNSPVNGAGRTHARAMLGLLGWRDLPPEVWKRLDQLITPSKINGLADVLPNDRALTNADDHGQPRTTADDRHGGMHPTSTALLNTIDATRARLGCGRTKVRQLVKARDLEAVKLGRRTLITEASLQQFVSRLPRVGKAAPRSVSQ